MSPIGGYFTHPILYWVGMDLAPASAEETEAFRRHYADVHRREVVERNPGFELSHQYELTQPDPRGLYGPRWLTIYELSGEQALAGYLDRHERPGAPAMGWTPGPPVWRDKRSTTWRMMWRRGDVAGAPSGAPASLRLIGMDPAADSDDRQLAEFNEFYSGVHVPEVMSSTPFALGARYERVPEFSPRPADAPRYCAAYEAGAGQTAELDRIRSARSAQPAKRSEGPPAWQRRQTRWRLSYRRVA